MFSGIASCVFFFAAIVVVAWPLWKVFEKAGYPGITSVLAYVPIVNLVLLWYAALNEWPIERELRARRGEASVSAAPAGPGQGPGPGR